MHNLTKLINKTISYKNKTKQNTYFQIKIKTKPLIKTHNTQIQPHIPTNKKHSTTKTPNKHYKLLLIKNNLINQKIINTILQKLNYNIHNIKNNKKTINTIHNNLHPNLIIINYQTPIINKFKTTQQIHT